MSNVSGNPSDLPLYLYPFSDSVLMNIKKFGCKCPGTGGVVHMYLFIRILLEVCTHTSNNIFEHHISNISTHFLLENSANDQCEL